MPNDVTIQAGASDPQTRAEFDGGRLVRGLRLGECQTEGPLAIFPIFANGGEESGGEQDESGRRAARYITLRQALGDGRVTITEVSEGGSVPVLRVVNEGDTRILLLDGEELRGARQNRVLSTTILIGKGRTLVVPVSCTEQGRWAYTSRQLAESEIVAERQVRYAMKESTNVSLRRGAGTRVDQGRVWDQVRDLHHKHRTVSPTAAMRDAYSAKKPALDRVLAAFPLMDGQTGLLVLHGSRAVGLDYVSRAPQYAELHEKLLRSYAFEALVRGGEPGDRHVAEAFLERVATLPGQRFKSPGLGWDVRFEGSGVLGSALVYRKRAVHAAFFDVGGASGAAYGGPAAGRTADWRRAATHTRSPLRGVPLTDEHGGREDGQL